MELYPIRRITVETLPNYSDRRVRVAWRPREGAVGYDIYASFQPYEPANKINSGLITDNYFDIIPPKAPPIHFYIWVVAEDDKELRTVFAKRGVSWHNDDIGFKSQLGVCIDMDFFTSDEFLFDCDPYFRDVANNVVWPRPGTRLFNRPVSGVKDGANQTFGTEFSYKAGTLVVVVNGEELEPSEFNENQGRSFEMVTAPAPADEIHVHFDVAV